MEEDSYRNEKGVALCPHFRRCGGCSWMDVPYKEQLIRKNEKIKTYLRVFKDAEISEIVPADDKHFYRNKMEFTFGGDSAAPLLGQHYKGSFHRIENLTRCFLFDERIGEILKRVRKFARDFELPPYNPKNHEGLLRHLKVRVSKTTGEVMVVLITSRNFDKKDEFVEVFSEFPYVKSIFHGINSRLSDVADCDELFLLKGNPYLTEKLGNIYFLVSPESFFQPNTFMSRRMYDAAREMINPEGKEYVLDLYSGSGGIGVYIAREVKFLYSIELDSVSVDILKKNLELNKIKNAEVLCGDVRKILPLVKRREFDIAFVDPPRSGMSKKAIRRVVERKIKKLIFFSCKIETAIPNLIEFEKYGFRVTKAVPFDMFPHTPYAETVFLLER
ncbi:MAG: 23S rRNA (uracil(1939)-C(5))-methyltransferase RlmD [Elusimicrobia bacterium]|nr:23S rRNA (uracil(1939)-C(5))-methyltransferase RlmD [Elusimicrobiota bacterium]